MKTKFYKYIVLAFISLTLFSCNEEEALAPQSQAEFTPSATTVAINESIQFTNNSQNATAYKWSFGDGTTSKQVSPKKSYGETGKFLVSLVSTGSGGSTISNVEITVTSLSSFIVENEEDLKATVPVQFASTSLGADSFSWSFGDSGSSTSAAENPTFAYPNAGTFTVTLTTSNANGENTFTKQITIADAPVNPGELYYIALNDDFIRKLNLGASGTTTDILDIAGKGGIGMAYDNVNNKIYFSDFDTYPNGKIWRMNKDGSNLENIVSNIGDPYAIALNITAGKILWVDDDGNVSKANLDGSNQEIGFLNIPGAQWRAISLDVENNKMYAYDVNAENLYQANLDGTNASIIVSGVYGYAILVDTVNDKIYFDDQNSDELKIANLDGSNMQTVSTKATRIYGMQIDYQVNKLYWSGRDTGELYRADLDGSNSEVLQTGIASPRGIALIK
jgi:PKD repeat protein